MTKAVIGITRNWVIMPAIAVIALVVLVVACQATTVVTKGEMRAKGQWVKEHLLDQGAPLPFSFVYDGRASDGFMSSWNRSARAKKLDRVSTQHELTWTDAATGLVVRCVAVDYSDYPVVEWTVYLKNTGKGNTPIVENLQALDTRFTRSSECEFVLHGNKGEWCVAESYEPFALTLGPNAVKRFAPPDYSGKSTDGPDGWPYYNLTMPGGGVIIVVGWPGQWASSFTRDNANGLRATAGQQLTRMYLKPGEEIRTPLIATLFWQGSDVARAQNIWRRWYMAHVIPNVDGKPQPPTMQIQVDGSLESGSLDAYARAGVKPDICWRDAGAGSVTWYPSDVGPYKGNDAWLNTGTWDIDKTKFPDGFKPFSDKVRAQGMQFLLWFEPERVGSPESWLGKNHPEWLLPQTETTVGAILDEGNPEARKWLTDHIDGMIKSQGLDWYREDMNGCGPLPAWRKNDPEDRQGITENLYVQGHLAFWDELRRRNPSLRIDSCASGGRRNDLETMRRAVPLLRSDFQFGSMENVIEGNQGHTYGISSWLPWYGSGCVSRDTYWVRSFYMPGFGMPSPSNRANRAVVKNGYDECRMVAPLMLGDYYPLTPYSLDLDKWIAWQFNRPEQGDGMVQAFRRSEARDETINVKLRGLNSRARYKVTNIDSPTPQYFTGGELMNNGLKVNAKSRPSAIIITYRKAE